VAALMAKPHFQLVEGDLSTVDLGPMLEGADYEFHQAAQAGATGTADVGHTAAGCEQAQRLLDFVPAVDIIEGLHHQVSWQLGVCTTPLQEGGQPAAAV
jgi:hypothetical protein